MRGMLEDDMTARKRQQLKELQAYNQMLSDQKRAREKNWRNNQQSMNATELDVTYDMVFGRTDRPITQPSQFTLTADLSNT